tara:strand:- start:13173 stop:13583 length:411 start_codon:yes stop_codon:yes gene_type:complete
MKNLFLLSAFLLFTSCNQKTETSKTEFAKPTTSEYVNISASDFNTTFTSPDSNTVILDVRTVREYEAGAIPNSVQLDFMSPDFKDEVSKLDPDKTYVVYCQSGRRSSAASKIMTQELGFKDVKNLEGGYSVWSKNN